MGLGGSLAHERRLAVARETRILGVSTGDRTPAKPGPGGDMARERSFVLLTVDAFGVPS